MKLLIVTPTLGRSSYLEALGVSIQTMRISCRHMIMCPESVCGELSRTCPDAIVEADPSMGMYGALNTALAAAADEDFFTWINDDDILNPEGLASAIACLEASPKLGGVYGKVRLIDSVGATLGWIPICRSPADIPALSARGTVPFAQPGTVLRLSTVKRLGGFDPTFRLAGDFDLFVRMALSGGGFSYVPEEVASFRLHGGQLSKNESEAVREKSIVLKRLGAVADSGCVARLRFTLANLGVYLDRVRRHGFVNMKQLYRHG